MLSPSMEIDASVRAKWRAMAKKISESIVDWLADALSSQTPATFPYTLKQTWHPVKEGWCWDPWWFEHYSGAHEEVRLLVNSRLRSHGYRIVQTTPKKRQRRFLIWTWYQQPDDVFTLEEI